MTMGNGNTVDDDVIKVQLKFIKEKTRLESFTNWPYSSRDICNAITMAQAGFYSAGGDEEPDLVKCFVCEKPLDGWEVDDDPWSEHRKHSPECWIVKTGKMESEYTVRQHLELTNIIGRSVLKKQYEHEKERLSALKLETCQKLLSKKIREA